MIKLKKLNDRKKNIDIIYNHLINLYITNKLDNNGINLINQINKNKYKKLNYITYKLMKKYIKETFYDSDFFML